MSIDLRGRARRRQYEIKVVNDGDARTTSSSSGTARTSGHRQHRPRRLRHADGDLEEGEYVFYCSIGNHRAMGMEVTVTGDMTGRSTSAGARRAPLDAARPRRGAAAGDRRDPPVPVAGGLHGIDVIGPAFLLQAVLGVGGRRCC